MVGQILQQRRKKLLARMVNGSAALFFSAAFNAATQAADVRFHQQSDFWYFTAFNEPMALLVLIKTAAGEQKTVLFNRCRDSKEELWQERRLGPEDAITQLGVDEAFPYEKVATMLPRLLNRLPTVYHAFGCTQHGDQLLLSVLDSLHKASPSTQSRAPTTFIDWRTLVYEMRLLKSPDEITLLRRAAAISALGHCRAMRTCGALQFEYQLAAEVHHEFAQHGATMLAYNTIVGSGVHGCILHYQANSAPLRSGELVLLDAGCKYHGYASDITRTFPVNGQFSAPQRALYHIVLQAQKEALEQIKPGSCLKNAYDCAVFHLVTGLVALGILQGSVDRLIADQAYQPFFMHNIGHWLGIDVHDVGTYAVPASGVTLAPGMALTIEPGLYIAPHAPVPEIYRGIGIRIEESVVVTPDGCEVLSDAVPKEIDAVEAYMQGALPQCKPI